MNWYRQLHWQIIIGLAVGLLWGLISSATGTAAFTTGYIKPFGTIFVNLLQLIAVPLVITSLVVGIASLNDTSKLSRMGGKTILIYIVTTIFAISIGLATVNLMKPGKVLPEETRAALMESYQESVEGSDEVAQEVLEQSPLQFLVDLVPQNVLDSFSDNGNMLQVVFVAVLLGIGVIRSKPEQGRILTDFLDSLNEVIIVIVGLIMKAAPFGVFALMATVIVDLAGEDLVQAFHLLRALGWYALAVVIGLFLHVMVVYNVLLKIYSPIKLSDFFRSIQPAMLLGFSTSSSAATLPVTMERVEKKLGVHEEVSGFVLPVGTTLNMDGTSLYQGVSAVFIAQALGMDLSLIEQLSIVLTATLASIGTAGVPGAGIIMLVIVLQAIHVPVEGIALILGVERLLDMFRTAVNVTGDAAVAVAVAGSEDLLESAPADDESSL